MKIRLIIASIVVFYFIATGCNGVSNPKTVLTEKIEHKLTEWKFNPETNLETTDNEIEINIYFKKDSTDSPDSFLMLGTSNFMLMLMIYETFYSDLDKYKSITYNFSFENQMVLPKDVGPVDFEDYSVTLSKNQLNEYHEEFVKSPRYYDFVEYTFKEIGNINVARIEENWIKFHHNETELIDFEGSFWSLLYEYSVICDHPEEFSGTSIYNFMTVLNSACDTEYSYPIRSEKLYYYFESCNLGIEPEWIGLPLKKMWYKLDKHFTKTE